MPPIPITYVVASMQTSEAGTEGHLLRLIRGLDRQRFTPRLVVLQVTPWLERFSDEKVPVEVLGFQSFFRLQDWKHVGRLSSCFRRHAAQIVELHFLDAHVLGAMAARLAGVPMVISCRRDLGHQLTLRTTLMTRLANPWIDRFLANSRLVADTMARREWTSRQRYDVIPNGVDLRTFDQAGREDPPAEFLAAIQGKQVVAMLTNLRPVKNIPGFLTAAARVLNSMPNVCFVILGAGDQQEPLIRLAEQLGISRSIIWAGSVENPASYLAHAHIGCLTSHAEGFSNAILEYMAARLPVVATRVGGAEEAVVDGTTGYLVESGDMAMLAQHILQLLQDDVQRETMGIGGRRRVENNFSQDVQLAAYQTYYENIARIAMYEPQR